jgi:hypothetical protein
MAQLDSNFMKRATQVTSFNLTANDFTSIRYKKEIQTLYSNYMFPSLDPDKTLTTLTVEAYNRLVRQLKSNSRDQYEKLHYLALKGVGPGEAALYLLTKNGHLGGGSSAGIDLIVGATQYEVKAAKWKSKATKTHVSDFKLGGGLNEMVAIENDIQNLAYDLKLKPRGAAEISGSLFEQMKAKAPAVYGDIEKRYQNIAGKYFGNHQTIFIQNERNQSDFGEILAIKKVRPTDILMERYTSKTIKPIVKIR